MRTVLIFMFFFNDTATTEIYTLSLHDALPICRSGQPARVATGGDWRYCYDGRDSENQRGNTMSRNPREASSRPTVALTYRPAEKKVEIGRASCRERV